MLRFLGSTTSIVCLILAALMIRASVWQWDRHIQKQALIRTLQETLQREPVELTALVRDSVDWSKQLWRRVHIAGTYDFEREVIVRRNRGANEHAGFHVITPLKLDNSELYLLVDRGFIPLGRESREFRRRYHAPARIEQYALLKQSSEPTLLAKFLAPDPVVAKRDSWTDLWIRVNVAAMQKQLPYPVLPVYVELMSSPDDPLLPDKIVKGSSAARNDVLALTGQKQVETLGLESPDVSYPMPHFDTTPPPDIHLGYVYEWAFMALLTLGIGVVSQLKRWQASK